jgi:hypothetical protein
MVINNVFKLLFLTSACFVMQAIEVRVVDHNGHESIADYIKDVPVVSIFGATPRYSSFARYKQVLSDHSNKLIESYKKSRRLKGVNGTVKSVIKALVEEHGITNFADAFDGMVLEQQMGMFLNLGLDQTILANNFTQLSNLASSVADTIKGKLPDIHIAGSSNHLIHVMLPCYFNDIGVYLQNGPLTYENLYSFLKIAAHFYKNYYEHTALKSDLRVYIVIPPLDYFAKLVNSINSDESMTQDKKDESIADVLYEEVITQLDPSTTYILINQNPKEIDFVVHQLYKKGVDHKKVGKLVLPIFSGCSPTEVFNPYVLKREKVYQDYRESPLIRQGIISYLAGVDHDAL